MKYVQLLFLVTILCAGCIVATAQEIQWKQTNGPNAGYINCIVEHNKALYVGTDGMGIFRSDAEGKHWALISDENLTAWSICFVDDTIFTGTLLYGIMRSTDAGETWTEMNKGVPRRVIDKDTTLPPIRSLLLRNDILFAGTFNYGLLRSTNRGENWTKVTTLPVENIICTYIEGNDFYVGTNKGIFRSGDDGATWTALNTGLSDDAVYSIVKSGSTWYAGMYQTGVYRSEDAATWQPMNNGLTLLQVWGMYATPTTVYAGTHGNGVFKMASTDTTWANIKNGFENADVRTFYGEGETVYVGSFNGILKSPDNGATWAAVGLPRTVISSLTTNGQSVFTGIFAGGVARTEDNGDTWNKVNNGAMKTATIVQCLATKDGSVFAGIYGTEGVYRTNNNGDTWTITNNGLPASTVWDIAVNGADILAATNEGVYRSANNGDSWTLAGDSLQTVKVTCLAAKGATIFAGTPDGIYRSTDNGVEWTAVNSGLTNGNINTLILHGQNIYAGAIGAGGIFRSTDNGDTWTAITDFSGKLGLSFASKGTAVLAGTNQGIYSSDDGGTTWKKISSGLTTSDVNAIVVQGTKLFAGTNGGGVFYTDAGTLDVGTEVTTRNTTFHLRVYESADNIILKCTTEAVGRLVISNIAGNIFRTVELAAGEQSLSLPSALLSSGVYYCTITSGSTTETLPFVIAK